LAIQKILDVNEAVDIAQDFLLTDHKGQSEIPVVLREHTEEYDFGWVLYYDYATCIKTNDDMDGMIGNAPLIGNKHTGEMLVTGTAKDTQFYISNYQETGDPHVVHPSRIVEMISSVPEVLESPKHLGILRSQSGKQIIRLLIYALDKFLTSVRAIHEEKEKSGALDEEIDESLLMFEWLISASEIDLDITEFVVTKEYGKRDLWSIVYVNKADAAIEDVKRVAYGMLDKGVSS
jgi:hypothetical protein